MNIAISNLAWNNEDLEENLDTLKRNDIHSIEIAYTKIKPWASLSLNDIQKFKSICNKKNITIPATQAIFYQSNLSDFNEINKTINHMETITKLTKETDTKIIVIGAPELRKNNSKNNFIKSLTQIDKFLSNTKICIEPLGHGDYFKSIEEINNCIQEYNLINIRTMIDTNSLTNQQFDLIEQYEKYHNVITHIHFSNHNLNEIEDFDQYKPFVKLIKQNYQHAITYELNKYKNFEITIKKFRELW